MYVNANEFLTRHLSLTSQVTLVITGMLDLILVTRLNQRFGIPDHAFVVGDEAVQDAIDNLRMVPMQVRLAAHMSLLARRSFTTLMECENRFHLQTFRVASERFWPSA